MCVWVEDADKLQLDDNELNIVYYNRAVNNFLSNNNSLGIAGIKGQGKTFLIKVKKKMIIEQQSGVLCLPKNVMLDTVDSSIVINRSLISFLIDYNIWVDLWKISICIASLKAIMEKTGKAFSTTRLANKYTKNLLELENPRFQPSTIMAYLLSMNINEIRCVLSDTNILMNTLSQSDGKVCIFIDKIDQGFSRYVKNINEDSRDLQRSRNASFWQYSQYSLAEASYDIYSLGAHHIKVYYTIRQEALIDAEKVNKDKARNINSFISILQYTKNDLKSMYEMYIENEDKRNLINKAAVTSSPSMAFVGIDRIAHSAVLGQTENVFDYIYRHTFKRPFDLMFICKKIYMHGIDIDVSSIRHVVNEASDKLMEMYINEISTFLPCEIKRIEEICTMINGNVLTLQYMKEVCKVLNADVSESWNCNENCFNCSSIKPFSILQNIGLIGHIKQNPTNQSPIQEFMGIGNGILQVKTYSIHASEYYFTHPCLANKARSLRNAKGLGYTQNTQLIVGDGYSAELQSKEKMKTYVKGNLKQFLREKVFVSSTINNLVDVRNQVESILRRRGLHPVMSEKPEFDVSGAQNEHSHDYCLDEMLKCGSVIFIIGNDYGGKYSGEKYRYCCEEIVREAKIAEKEIIPSISLMEYYVARRNKLACYAYMSKELEDAVRGKNSTIEVSDAIITEVKFINHIRIKNNTVRGNWISSYTNNEDLMKRISKLKFNRKASNPRLVVK